MKRLTAPLVLIGVALLGVALWLYNTATGDKAVSDSICRIGSSGSCDSAISWTPTLVVAALAAVSLVAALVISKRSEDLVD